jgi:peptidoglycan hydrolase-like protein with peptidoglycan-binding domain
MTNNIKRIGMIVSAMAIASTPFLASAAALNRELEVGDRGADVSVLQTFLALDVTIYPQGLVTGYFGFLTKSAVSNFQSRNGISSVGRVGPQTLPVINAQIANGPTSGVDLSAPTVSSVNIGTTNSSATINFGSTDFARAKVYYSTSPIYMSNTFDATGFVAGEPIVSGTLAPTDLVVRMSHSVGITGLSSNTVYYYMIVVLDASNNFGISAPASFRTAI